MRSCWAGAACSGPLKSVWRARCWSPACARTWCAAPRRRDQRRGDRRDPLRKAHTVCWRSGSACRGRHARRFAVRRAAEVVRRRTSLHGNDELRRILRDRLPAQTFEDLAVPFECVAASIERAREHWFNKGDLIEPVLASCALPGVFPPVQIGDEHFFDGGLVNSIPLDRAVALGADTVWVLHVGVWRRNSRRRGSCGRSVLWPSRSHADIASTAISNGWAPRSPCTCFRPACRSGRPRHGRICGTATPAGSPGALNWPTTRPANFSRHCHDSAAPGRTVPLATLLIVCVFVSGPLLLAVTARWDWRRGRAGRPGRSPW